MWCGDATYTLAPRLLLAAGCGLRGGIGSTWSRVAQLADGGVRGGDREAQRGDARVLMQLGARMGRELD